LAVAITIKRVIDIKLFRIIDKKVEVLSDLASEWSGKPLFLFLHLIWWGIWIGLGVEPYPFGMLTLIVSLEAICLSGLILSSQNRQRAYDIKLLKQTRNASADTENAVEDIYEEIQDIRKILEDEAGDE
jgi:uncharacterized membrane protein